jgi:DNA-binding protein YbaB
MWGNNGFDLAGLQELQRQAEELAGQLSAAAAAAGSEFVGADSTGVIEVTIDSGGAPVRVRLERDWSRIVGANGLGPAVVGAVQAAGTELLTAWAAGVAQAQAVPPVTSDGSGRGRVEHAEPGDPSSRQSAYAIRDVLDLVDAALDRMGQLQEAAEDAANRHVTSTNPTHTVRVTTVGGVVEGVEFDETWLRSAHQERIAGAIQEALAASGRAVAEENQRLHDSVPGLDRIRQLTSSPETLLREIGLIR